MPTIQRVQAEVERINSSHILPPGVRIERIYDRKDLIDITTSTVLHNMVIGIALIFFLQWLFLGNLRSAVIVGMTIPFALFFAVGILVIRGESANLLSVGAIDFGLIVDATVIMVESIFRWLSGHGNREATEEAIRTLPPAGLHGKRLAIFHAAADVNRSIFFAAGIIIAGFIPLFTLSGVEGHIFGPMAQTYAYALAGGLIATFTVTPALSALILPEHVKETETFVVRALHRVYTPMLGFSIRHKAVDRWQRDRSAYRGCRLRRALARTGVPAEARGGQSLGARHAAVDDLARGGQHLRQPDAPGRLQLPGGGIRRLPARPAGRRHRRRRLLQRGVVRAAEAQERMAPQGRQGRPDRRGADQAAGRIPRRGIQLLAIPAGQRRRGGFRREGRELDQAVRQRPSGHLRYGRQDQIGAGDGSRRHRSCGVHLARPADRADRHRPQARLALRPEPGRHQRDDQDGDRRRFRRRSVRAEQRPAFPDRRAACAGVQERAWRTSAISRSRCRIPSGSAQNANAAQDVRARADRRSPRAGSCKFR